MTPINPLNTYAEGMISSVAKNSPGSKTYIKRFFSAANSTDRQGNALIAYYTELNKFAKTSKFTDIPAQIEKEIREIPELSKEADTFVRALGERYPETLEKRISIASQGAVTSDKVEPKSRLKKFFIRLNEFMKPEE